MIGDANMRKFLSIGCAVALVLGGAAAHAQVYSLTEVGAPNTTANLTLNWGSVNDSGEITGTSTPVAGGASSAFVFSNGTLTLLKGSAATQGFGINDAGQVTGSDGTCAFTATNNVVTDLETLAGPCSAHPKVLSEGIAINESGKIAGFSYVNGNAEDVKAAYFSGTQIESLGTLGGTASQAYGVNAKGVVTGWAENASGDKQAFVTLNGALVGIGTLGGSASFGYGINLSGQVAGKAQIAGNGATHGFFYSDGIMHDIGTLGGINSVAYAINDAGDVVGEAGVAAGAARAVLVSNGALVNLNSLINPSDPLAPYVTLTSATGISNAGYIAAEGTDVRYPGVAQVFLLTPINEAPVVTPVVTGTPGQNGWYVSSVTLSWNVVGGPPPTTTGCATVTVPNTKGTTYTCAAVNSLGSASDSVTIKEDTTAPTARVVTPSSGANYALGQSVTAAYTCADTISGVASCVGTVADGALVPTSTAGQQQFVVTATDNAGNVTTKTITYTVN
jgi:probable HAF family extracellular repeat protein